MSKWEKKNRDSQSSGGSTCWVIIGWSKKKNHSECLKEVVFCAPRPSRLLWAPDRAGEGEGVAGGHAGTDGL